jgi:hypothetical protein
MAENRNMTPRVFTKVWTSFSLWKPHFNTDAGTFNGVAYGAASNTSVLTSRWWFCNFSASGSPTAKRNAVSMSFHLPYDYIDGTDIKVRLHWTSSEVDAGSETVDWIVGVTRQNGTALGGESETEYITDAAALTSVAGEFPHIVGAKTTFSGTNFTNGEAMAIVVARDAGADSADDISYLCVVEVFYQRESIAQETNKSNRVMTPILYTPLYKDVSYATLETNSQSGTFGGLSCTTNSIIVDSSGRWAGLSYVDGADANRTFNWIIPPDYKTGSSIHLTLKYFGSTSSTNDVWFFCGLTTDSAGNTFGTDSDAEHIAPTSGSPTAMAATAETESTITWEFSGTNQVGAEMAAGDPVAFSMIRQGTTGSDNYTGSWRTLEAVVQYETEEEGSQT